MKLSEFKELRYTSPMITRAYEPLDPHVQPNKVLVFYGPRRVGKTTLLQNYLAQTPFR